MSNGIVAAIVVSILVIICLLLLHIANKQKRNYMNKFLTRFSELGSQNNVNFSSQVVLKNCVMGLDGVNRKVLIMEEKDGVAFFNTVIDLHDVESCSVKKQYASINGGDLKNRKMDTYLQKITLQFKRRNLSLAEMVFYNHMDNQVNEIAGLTNKAKHWEAILNKILNPRLETIA